MKTTKTAQEPAGAEKSAEKKAQPEAARQRWRENIEALVMAIVVALLFKYFILEISKIPSGSMQPTLMGNPETGAFDRTLVDKLCYHYRDPERFEIVVFKHPLERSRIMVKRLVGMPSEELRIEHGDLWVRVNEDEPWQHLRRPASVQRASWRWLARDPRSADWGVVREGKEWRVGSDSLSARGDGAARFRPDAGPIRDRYVDGYPSALAGKIEHHPGGDYPVGDVRLEGEVAALDGTRALRFELTEGQRVYEFTLPGPAAPADAEISVRIRDSATSSERVERGERFRLAPGTRTRFALENLDDRLAFELDGRTVLAAEIETSLRQEAHLTLALEGAGADLTDLCVARDVYYLPPDAGKRSVWTVQIPAGNYVMLGDNTQDSADGRLWTAQSYAYRAEDGATVRARGNQRQDRAPKDRDGSENPMAGQFLDGTPAFRFRDVWGEVHWFSPRAIERDTVEGNAPLVPRELVVGRGIAVFWPIRPWDRLWRLGWLH